MACKEWFWLKEYIGGRLPAKTRQHSRIIKWAAKLTGIYGIDGGENGEFENDKIYIRCEDRLYSPKICNIRLKTDGGLVTVFAYKYERTAPIFKPKVTICRQGQWIEYLRVKSIENALEHEDEELKALRKEAAFARSGFQDIDDSALFA